MNKDKDKYDKREEQAEEDGPADEGRHAKRHHFDDDEPHDWQNHKKRDSGKRRHRAKHGHERPSIDGEE